jgi:hypothetical protein
MTPDEALAVFDQAQGWVEDAARNMLSRAARYRSLRGEIARLGTAIYEAGAPDEALRLSDAGIEPIMDAWNALHADIPQRRALLKDRYWRLEAAMAVFKGKLPSMAPLAGDALRCDDAARSERSESNRCAAALLALFKGILKQERLFAPSEPKKAWVAV